MVIEQHGQQPKFDRRKVDLFFPSHDAAGGKIDADIAKGVHRIRRGRGTVSTQRHTKPGL
ncbi:hypothetical protein HR12_16650 [Microbacterium sp. SUBG005]|nr:hypothetical protein HR12_16650 [Microbacterium sp. SUBG005]